MTSSPVDIPDQNEDRDDVRPVVAAGKASNTGLWVFAGIVLLGAAFLFSALNARREALTAPNTLAVAPDLSSRISSPPPLALPQDRDLFLTERDRLPVLVRREPFVMRTVPAPGSIVQRPSTSAPLSRQVAPPVFENVPVPEQISLPPPAAALETGLGVPATTAISQNDDPAERVRAARLLNPAMTVPQGTVIPAVLETALDSTRPGAARALVQRNIHSFDGSRILIQRGSRLYGEYEAGIEAGQNRALIRWTRLVRPDGVTIALDSPASDPLGRAGVKGKVDSKFFQRFGGAILQSILDIGVGVATRKATDGVIVALPGSTQNVTPRLVQQEITRTLKVRHGTSVSVFVARDLDFSSVEL